MWRTVYVACMQTTAAVLRAHHQPWSVEEIELDPPGPHEVLVELAASGICHTQEHFVTGDLGGPPMPMIGGHEGAGVVTAVGQSVVSVQPGDHVVLGFIPACGRCPSCATGHSNVCDVGGAALGTGRQMADGTARHHDLAGNDISLDCLIGTFAHHTVVNEASAVKIDADIPLRSAALLGCGVVTGWGSAVYAADISPGDFVAVVGVGGIGANAVQGARYAGARVVAAIDPVEFKREKAEHFGATHSFDSMSAAMEALGEVTFERGFDKVIMAMGVGDGDALGEAFHLAGKRGRIVVTNMHPSAEQSLAIPASLLTLFEKRLVGSLFGSGNIRKDIPQLLELYTQGQLDLDEVVTRTYPLEDVNQGFEDLRENRNVRGLLVYD